MSEARHRPSGGVPGRTPVLVGLSRTVYGLQLGPRRLLSGGSTTRLGLTVTPVLVLDDRSRVMVIPELESTNELTRPTSSSA